MLTKEDVDKVARAFQNADIRPGILMCCIVVDSGDSSMAVLAPDGVNTRKVIEHALEHYKNDEPATRWETAPEEPS